MSSNIKFPRPLSTEEIYFLYHLLPESKPGYRLMKNKIFSYSVIGSKDDDAVIFMGKEGTIPDTVSPSTPVFALASYVFTSGTVDVVIHEEINEEIEIEFSGNINLVNTDKFVSLLTYSEWNPGEKSPEKKETVKEILIRPTPFLLAFSAADKKIWVHNIQSGVNTLIPLSNYYNSLMLYKNERKPGVALNPNLFFNNLDQYNNEELVNAFVMYNKYMKRFTLFSEDRN